MAKTPDLRTTIAAAQQEVASWDRRATLATHARPAGSKWPATVALLAALAIALYAERDLYMGWLVPHDSSDTVASLGEVLRHAAEDIETYRKQFGRLPDGLPIDFLNGIVTYEHDATGYVLETTYHDRLIRLRADASGPGAVEVLTR
jgi:hypothetical protein